MSDPNTDIRVNGLHSEEDEELMSGVPESSTRQVFVGLMVSAGRVHTRGMPSRLPISNPSHGSLPLPSPSLHASSFNSLGPATSQPLNSPRAQFLSTRAFAVAPCLQYPFSGSADDTADDSLIEIATGWVAAEGF